MHEHIDRDEAITAFARFHAENPEYEATRPLDELRMNDFARLEEQDHIYLDYTGSGLYGASQIRRHAQALLATILGNPHSANPTSKASTARWRGARSTWCSTTWARTAGR